MLHCGKMQRSNLASQLFAMKNSIDDIIHSLDDIIADAKRLNNPVGYFAALYRQVTITIRDKIAQGYFEDNERMERLDIIFANRYLEAYAAHKNNQMPTQSWAIAFNAAKKRKGIILQHLLLGINAHINLDLGIAAAETVGDGKLMDLKNDFMAINQILTDLVDSMQKRLAKASPLLGLLDAFASTVDEDLINFSMGVARDGAWAFAEKIYLAPKKERQRLVAERDFRIAVLADNLGNAKHRWLKRLIGVIGWLEWTNTTRILHVLLSED